MAPSATWAVQPEIEKSRTNKLCAKCEKPASRVCSGCRCTIYCGMECQEKHWGPTHKGQCSVDPLFSLSKELSLPIYREFNSKEKEEKNYAYTLLPGRLEGPETDLRDGYCKLIIATEPKFLEYLNMLMAGVNFREMKTNEQGQTNQQMQRKMWTNMGWTFMSEEVVTGFSSEDAIVFRIYFDDNFQNRIDLEENLIAHILLNCSGKTRGKFVVTKSTIKDGETTLIAFTKAELVDMMTWRVVCGRNQLVSSRMFRENMRRREQQGALTKMGFQTIEI